MQEIAHPRLGDRRLRYALTAPPGILTLEHLGNRSSIRNFLAQIGFAFHWPAERFEQRPEMRAVVLPTSNPAIRNRLAHLDAAGRLHGPAGVPKGQTALIPVQAAIDKQLARDGLL